MLQPDSLLRSSTKILQDAKRLSPTWCFHGRHGFFKAMDPGSPFFLGKAKKNSIHPRVLEHHHTRYKTQKTSGIFISPQIVFSSFLPKNLFQKKKVRSSKGVVWGVEWIFVGGGMHPKRGRFQATVAPGKWMVGRR